jgi:50S ribosomal protein L16 3-hydroxylase
MPSAKVFFSKYWGKHPVLMRGAWHDCPSPLLPDEIAGLACEAEIPSRFVRFMSMKSGWSVDHGPFDQDFFANTGEKNWSLLVQDVDSFVPAVAALWQRVPNLPLWRRDDVMVNFSVDGGNVGPHLDNYDVFLYQASGIKKWAIGFTALQDEVFRPKQALRILQDFQPDVTWDVLPGDILYLPARVPHYGIAVGDGITYSFGFRAPSMGEALLGSAVIAAERAGDSLRVTDPPGWNGDSPHPGEIDDAMVEHILKTMKANLPSRSDVRLWLCETLSTSLRRAAEPSIRVRPETIAKKVAAGKKLFRNPRSRTFYFQENNQVVVASHGVSFTFPASVRKLAAAFCNSPAFAPVKLGKNLNSDELHFLAKMISENSAYFE